MPILTNKHSNSSGTAGRLAPGSNTMPGDRTTTAAGAKRGQATTARKKPTTPSTSGLRAGSTKTPKSRAAAATTRVLSNPVAISSDSGSDSDASSSSSSSGTHSNPPTPAPTLTTPSSSRRTTTKRATTKRPSAPRQQPRNATARRLKNRRKRAKRAAALRLRVEAQRKESWRAYKAGEPPVRKCHLCGDREHWVFNCVKYGAWVAKMRAKERPVGVGLVERFKGEGEVGAGPDVEMVG